MAVVSTKQRAARAAFSEYIIKMQVVYIRKQAAMAPPNWSCTQYDTGNNISALRRNEALVMSTSNSRHCRL